MSENVQHIIAADVNGLGCGLLLILLAWQAGEITEGRASTMLGVDRVAARELLQASVEHGRRMAHEDGFLVKTRCSAGRCRRRHLDD